MKLSIGFVVSQLLIALIMTNPALSRGLSSVDPNAETETGPDVSHSASKVASVDPTLLPPQEEFFLDMFIDRYPVDGGYRVKRFYGSEFFDVDRERAIEKKRQTLEALWNRRFHTSGLPTTPLSHIQMPFKSIRCKVTGFKNRPTKGFPGHKAYDIIVAEGTPVHPIGYGIVVATEGSWWKKVNKGESIRIDNRSWWDTVELEQRPLSLKSGNFAVIYHPPAPRTKDAGYYSFYAHMADGVLASPGQIVGPNDRIGTVEHSGYNAMRRGHGGHLHISVLKNLGRGYLEPIKFAKYWGIAEEHPKRRWSKTAVRHHKLRARGRRRA